MNGFNKTFLKVILNIVKSPIFVLILIVIFYRSCSSTNPVFFQSDIIVGSKNFTENELLGEMYYLVLKDAGFNVGKKLGLGGTIVAHESLKNANISLYPEYIGTGLTVILKLPSTKNIAKDYKIVARQYKKNWNIVWLPYARNASNSHGMVVTKQVAERYNIKTISRLSEIAHELRMATLPEFGEREDGFKGLKKLYGSFDFKKMSLYEYGLKYKVLLTGEADVTIGFTTDSELSNDRLVLLEDDKKFWPPYNIAPVVRAEILEKYPQIEPILNNVNHKLSTETLQRLNAEIDMKKREVPEVAKEFLKNEGIIQ